MGAKLIPGDLPEALWQGRGSMSGPVKGGYLVLSAGPFTVASGEAAASKAAWYVGDLPGLRVISISASPGQTAGAATTTLGVLWTTNPAGGKGVETQSLITDGAVATTLQLATAGTLSGQLVSQELLADNDSYLDPDAIDNPNGYNYLLVRGTGSTADLTGCSCLIVCQFVEHINTLPSND